MEFICHAKFISINYLKCQQDIFKENEKNKMDGICTSQQVFVTIAVITVSPLRIVLTGIFPIAFFAAFIKRFWKTTHKYS